jgi:DNA polymerase
MKKLHLDFETYSELDIRKVGAYKYAMHESTEALMLAWQIDEGMIHMWDIHGGEEFPQRLMIALKNESVLLKAFNATFERLIFKYVLNIDLPIERWRCTMCRAYSLSFQGTLDEVLSQFVPGHEKDKRGKQLIDRFSKRQPASRKVSRWTKENDPEGYKEFKEYCIQDVKVEHALSDALEKYPYHERENLFYWIDQVINDAGVPIDTKLVDRAISFAKIEKEKLLTQMKELTGLENPNSGKQLHVWLEENGFPLEDLTKDTVGKALNELSHKITNGELIEQEVRHVYDVLDLKRQVSKTSVTKWNAFKKYVCDDGKIYGMFQFAGASRTNRWAGRGPQLHNMARGKNTTKDPATLADYIVSSPAEIVEALYGDIMLALSDTVRCAITVSEDEVLNVSDLKSIESVIIGWLTNCRLINEIFATGRDTYKVFATHLFKVPYEKVTKKMRTDSKPPVLGGGYMLGGGKVKPDGSLTGLLAYADGMGIALDPQTSKEAIRIFREDLFPEIVDYWGWLEEAIFYCVKTGVPVHGDHGIRFEMNGEFLFMYLPSGRAIAYHKPMILPRKMPWGEIKDSFTYMGRDRLAGSYKWARIAAHMGSVVENAVQGIARDVLCEWLLRIYTQITMNSQETKTILHVHDEVGVVSDRDRTEQINALLEEPMPWAPDLSVGAAGFTTRRYYKD